MAQSIVLLVLVLYFITGLDFIRQGQIGMGVTFLMYSGANLGLFLAAKGI